ncbi:MAG TPA: glycosyltransferase [Caulobacteraceae bacterium]|nr:glycosyltransferase [Caulobacteraceae bacterium]
MISVVIATLNAAETLPAALSALVPAAMNNLVREVVIADAGSTDETLEVVEDAGARLIAGDLAAGLAAAKGPWLLVLDADVRLAPEWEAAARDHIEHHPRTAGYFRLALDDHRTTARLMEVWASLKGATSANGVLVSKRLYDEMGKDVAKLRGRMRPLAARAFRIVR